MTRAISKRPKTCCSPITYANLSKYIKEADCTLPVSTTNQDGEDVIISEGSIDGNHYYELQTLQKNGWIRTNCYYVDGTVDESFSR